MAKTVPTPAQAAEEARRKAPGQHLIAFGVYKDTEWWVVKYTLDGGIVAKMEKIRNAGPYEALAYEHLSAVAPRYYMEMQISRAQGKS